MLQLLLTIRMKELGLGSESSPYRRCIGIVVDSQHHIKVLVFAAVALQQQARPAGLTAVVPVL